MLSKCASCSACKLGTFKMIVLCTLVGKVCAKEKLSATAACWHASLCYMRTALQLIGKVNLLLTEENAGLVIHAHVQDLHSIHSLQG